MAIMMKHFKKNLYWVVIAGGSHHYQRTTR
jgi:hypothetical protein